MARGRVLICEDEGLTSLRLRSSLRKLGYEVVGDAKDGEAAVAAAAELAPDIILMDIRMPKLDGIAATQQIMSRKATAIVMITAHNDRELVQAAMRAGASAYDGSRKASLLPVTHRGIRRLWRPRAMRSGRPDRATSPMAPADRRRRLLSSSPFPRACQHSCTCCVSPSRGSRTSS
jgi:AmiR/NasT family two-component response regulator